MKTKIKAILSKAGKPVKISEIKKLIDSSSDLINVNLKMMRLADEIELLPGDPLELTAEDRQNPLIFGIEPMHFAKLLG